MGDLGPVDSSESWAKCDIRISPLAVFLPFVFSFTCLSSVFILSVCHVFFCLLHSMGNLFVVFVRLSSFFFPIASYIYLQIDLFISFIYSLYTIFTVWYPLFACCTVSL